MTIPDFGHAQIPVTYKGEPAVLSEVIGAGGYTWFLMINNFYKGQLVYTSHGFQFSTQQGYDERTAKEFEAVLMAWYS